VGGHFHPYRRKWASKRKHLPPGRCRGRRCAAEKAEVDRAAQARAEQERSERKIDKTPEKQLSIDERIGNTTLKEVGTT